MSTLNLTEYKHKMHRKQEMHRDTLYLPNILVVIDNFYKGDFSLVKSKFFPIYSDFCFHLQNCIEKNPELNIVNVDESIIS